MRQGDEANSFDPERKIARGSNRQPFRVGVRGQRTCHVTIASSAGKGLSAGTVVNAEPWLPVHCLACKLEISASENVDAASPITSQYMRFRKRHGCFAGFLV